MPQALLPLVAEDATRMGGGTGTTAFRDWTTAMFAVLLGDVMSQVGAYGRGQRQLSPSSPCQLSELVAAQREVARVDLGITDGTLEERSAADRRTVDRMAIARCLQQLGHLTTKPVRHLARKPKRPDSECRERWFDEQPRASDAMPATPSPARGAESDSSAREKKLLAPAEEGATMPACPTASGSSAATPHDLPPKRCARVIFNWLRRPIALPFSLTKAAKIK